MDSEEIISIITIIVTIIFGIFSKKSTFISNNLIPLQNIVIGIGTALVEYIYTKSFSKSIAISGLIAGGAYDVVNNLNKLIKNKIT